MITVTSMEAQNRFGQLLDTVQREPVSVTRHGRPAAYIISSDAYLALTRNAVNPGEKAAMYLGSINQFRGQGTGGGTKRLLADRRKDEKARK